MIKKISSINTNNVQKAPSFKGTAHLSCAKMKEKDLASISYNILENLEAYFRGISGKYDISNKKFILKYPDELNYVIEPKIADLVSTTGLKLDINPKEVIK